MNRVELIGAEKRDVRAALERLGSATLGESGGIPLDSRIGPIWSSASFAAPVYAVSFRPGDNLGLHVAVTTAPAGSALAVAPATGNAVRAAEVRMDAQGAADA